MKVNLEAGPNSENYREGYLNLFYAPVDSRVLKCHWSNLDDFVKDGEAQEILAEFILQKCPPNEIGNVIRHWNKKLASNGVLKGCFYDARTVCRDGNNRTMTLETIHNALLGQDYSFRCVLDVTTVKGILAALNFNLESMTMDNSLVTFEATKIKE